MSELLEVHDLTVHFATEDGLVEAVDNVSFSVRPGEILGVVGESGSGKSVTAHALLRLIRPPGRIVRGEIRFEGADLLRHNSDGKIYEVRVQVRTLIGIGHFGAALGPALARRRGPIRGALLRVSSPLLSAMFAMVDATATRFTQAR